MFLKSVPGISYLTHQGYLSGGFVQGVFGTGGFVQEVLSGGFMS